MNGLLAALSGALIVAGLLGIVAGLRLVPERPPTPKRPRPAWWASIPSRRRWAAVAALAIGVVAGAFTGWLVLIVVLPAVVLGLPVLLSTSTEAGRIARLDGIAEWTRNLSGVLIAGQGLYPSGADAPELMAFLKRPYDFTELIWKGIVFDDPQDEEWKQQYVASQSTAL